MTTELRKWLTSKLATGHLISSVPSDTINVNAVPRYPDIDRIESAIDDWFFEHGETHLTIAAFEDFFVRSPVTYITLDVKGDMFE